MRRHLLAAAFVQLFVVAPVYADIIIDGGGDFEAQVQACLEMIQGVGDGPANVLDSLRMSGNNFVIQENEGLGRTSYDNGAAANSPAFGGTGAGTGATIQWDPDFPYVYRDGVERDFCAALFHELSHAFVADTGTRRGGNDPATGIRRSEIGPNGATTLENQYRDLKGLEQRTRYGNRPLPPGSIIN